MPMFMTLADVREKLKARRKYYNRASEHPCSDVAAVRIHAVLAPALSSVDSV
jgi:hypothetical protein